MLPARALLTPRHRWRKRLRVRRRASGRTFAYNLRFPGQIFDGQAGLHQNGFRDYDPAVGRLMCLGCAPRRRTANNNAMGMRRSAEVFRGLPNSTTDEKAIRARCWESANQRFGNCVANRPLGPLVTWRRSFPIVPSPTAVQAPSRSSALPAVLLIFLIPWPGNPVYGGL